MCDNGDYGDIDATYDYLDIDTPGEKDMEDPLGIDELTEDDMENLMDTVTRNHG